MRASNANFKQPPVLSKQVMYLEPGIANSPSFDIKSNNFGANMMSPISNHMQSALPHVQIGVTQVKYPDSNYSSIATAENHHQKLKHINMKNDF